MEAERVAGPSASACPSPAFVTVTLAESGRTFRCRTDESLLEGMRRLGVKGIPIGCRSGGCSVCRIAIVEGGWAQSRPMSREYVDADDMAAGRVLACCVRPLEDVRIVVIGKLKKAVERDQTVAIG